MEIRDVTADDLDDILRVRTRSFGPDRGDESAFREQSLEFADAGRYLCASVDGEVVAAAVIRDFEQFWHGRSVSVAGVAGVVVAPEVRGRGVASRLMRGVLERSRALGHPLTALYPSAPALYRGLGYEFAGARHKFSFDARVLRSLPRAEVDVRRGGPDDATLLRELVGRARHDGSESGPLWWGERHVREWLEESNSFCYVADDGFVVYGWDDRRDLQVDELVARSPDTARALLAVVGSGSSIADRVHVYAAPHDPIHLLAPAEAAHEVAIERWMLRALDAPAAIGARGWSDAVDLDVVVRLDDDQVDRTAGTWRLQVADGKGSLTPADAVADGALTVGSRGLAALYAGTPITTLRRAGLAHGGDAAIDDAIDTAFGTAPPYLLDYF